MSVCVVPHEVSRRQEYPGLGLSHAVWCMGRSPLLLIPPLLVAVEGLESVPGESASW